MLLSASARGWEIHSHSPCAPTEPSDSYVFLSLSSPTLTTLSFYQNSVSLMAAVARIRPRLDMVPVAFLLFFSARNDTLHVQVCLIKASMRNQVITIASPSTNHAASRPGAANASALLPWAH